MRRTTPRTLGMALAISLLAWATFAGAADLPLTVQEVDSSLYPDVAVTVALPPSMTGKVPEFVIAENGEDVGDVEAVSSGTEAAPARIVLVIDTSGSMAGGQLDDARRAANRFVDSVGEGTSVALVAFDDSPHTVTGFTQDRAELVAAIDGLEAQGETSLYDALVSAAALLPRDPGVRRSIVVLSDGGDTVSDASFERVASALSKASVPMYGVAIKSDEYNPHALAVLAKRTGGRLVPVSKSSELGGLFETLAKEIGNSWVLRYKGVDPRTADIELDVRAAAGDVSAAATTVFRNPSLTMGPAQALSIPEVRDDPVRLVVTVGLAFLSIFLLVGGALLLLLRDRANLKQLRFYDQLQDSAADARLGGPADRVRAAVVDAVDATAGKRGFTQLASEKLEAAGMPLRAAEYMAGHLVFVVGLGVVVEIVAGNPALAIMAVVAATVLPLVAVDVAAERRRRRFEEQLPDVLGMMSGSLRGGWGVQQAIALAAQEAPQPSAGELSRVETETRLGMPLERALENMADRMASEDFRAVVTGVAIQREVGGNLAEVLDIVGKTIRDRQAIRRQLSSLTAEGRLSAYILVVLPFLVFAALLVVNPGYLVPLLTTSAGLFLLVLAASMLVVGSAWMWRMTKIEV